MGIRYLDEYRNPRLARQLLTAIHQHSQKPVKLMEICGTHTVAIFRSGLRELLPPTVRLVSGPGCPVCVTATEDIDRAIWLSRQPQVIVATFGDLLRVPGSVSSLWQEHSKGADVRMVYSSLDALRFSYDHPNRQIIFLGIGFETTAPTVAAAIKQASAERVRNFSVFSSHKLLPPAMHALLNAGDVNIDGFICPGHVSTVIGAGAYEPIADQYHVPCVVTGFEPLDILQGIYMLIDQLENRQARVMNQYLRGVTREGNRTAQKLMEEIFEPEDATWRGLGKIPASGLKLREKFRFYDATTRFDMPLIEVKEHPGCRCGEVLRGLITPPQCGLFRKVCSPQQPKGPCMVSGEGTCGAYYRYADSTTQKTKVHKHDEPGSGNHSVGSR